MDSNWPSLPRRVSCAILTLVALTRPVLAGDDVIGAECYQPLSAAEQGVVVAAVARVDGAAAAQELQDKIDTGEVNLVDTPGLSGTSDHNTIGIDTSQPGFLQGVVAVHEMEHQGRALAAHTPGEHSSGDPDTSWGDIDPGPPRTAEHPCNGVNHAAMGLADLIKMGYFACDGATAAEKAWICKNWREFKNRLYRQLQLSENLGCTTGPASHNAYLGQINEKPPCCN